jgi:hypothetical protein
MITQLKTALLGDGPRPDHNVGKVDPFRPAPYLVDGGRVGMDAVFGILGNQRRRYVLKLLSMAEEPLAVSDIVGQLVAWESGTDVAEITGEDRSRATVSLCQCHLPKMADSGAVSYDDQREEIERGEKFDHFAYYPRPDE